MARAITVEQLAGERRAYRNTGGDSDTNRELGFVPAFLDTATGIVYLSRNPDGTLACCHCLDGLPGTLVVERDDGGRAIAVKATVVSGFERGGCFYTREQAARFVGGG
ncbi:MAG: hypothetical protein PVF40_11800 [Ectothiorhodospiraceae bacterium]|jgi:hypothetical protein